MTTTTCHILQFRQQSGMSSPARVIIHPSQFPDAVRRDLLESLRTRRVNHKFLYDSLKQTQKWLALHQAYSPSRNDADCAATYDAGFVAAAKRIEAASIQLVGLGCGGGQKDTRLLRLLTQAGRRASYVPADVSVAMVLVAREAALAAILDEACHLLVCDLAAKTGLGAALDGVIEAGATRLITFFGTIHNFEPSEICSTLASLLRPADYLLLSANLAPGSDYNAGVERILPQYDNPLTRDWLLTFLLDLGVETGDGEMRFTIEDGPAGSALKRIVAYFHFNCGRRLTIDDENFDFSPGQSIRLFFSYRHTPESISSSLAERGVQVLEHWTTKSREEGVFLCRKRTAK